MASTTLGNTTAFGVKTSSVQMNVRLASELKAQGDAVFEMLGLTASQAVRMFYEFAASCKGNPDRLIEAVKVEDSAAEAERQERIRQKMEAVERGARLYEEGLKSLGLQGSSPNNPYNYLPYKELRDLAYLEKYEEECL